jgi:hypothetical protein
MTMGYSTALRNAQMDAKTAQVGNAGKFQLYDGTRPATGGAATTKLAEFTLGSPFAPGSSGGVLSPTLPSATTGLAASTATWGRLVTSGGTFVADYSVGTSGADVIVNTTTIGVGTNVSITGWTETAGNP